jgi:hypothetical protein
MTGPSPKLDRIPMSTKDKRVLVDTVPCVYQEEQRVVQVQ